MIYLNYFNGHCTEGIIILQGRTTLNSKYILCLIKNDVCRVVLVFSIVTEVFGIGCGKTSYQSH
jgi:hypothetical protein